MKILKKILKTILSLVIGLAVAVSVILVCQMYKPVLDAKKDIAAVDAYAMATDSKLVNREVKVIGLGEATHGNKEFQELKLDVLKTLVRENGVTAICFEMDYAEGVLINEYIHGTSEMTIEELFSHISFGIYHTEEIKNLIEWMKQYNAESQGGMLDFYGFDIQNPEVDVYVINRFAEEHQILTNTGLNSSLKAFLNEEFTFKSESTDEMLDALLQYKEELAKDEYNDYAEIDGVRMCIENVFRTKELVDLSAEDSMNYGIYRDTAMSEVVLEIAEKEGNPIMITGHNGHVGYAGSYVRTMGSHLKESLGDDYFVIGTDYFKTVANIKSGDGRKNYRSYSADPLAYQAKRLGTYYLRFEDAKEDEELNSVITGKMPSGSLGEGFSFFNAIMPASVRVYAPVSELYDGMIFVYEATPFTVLEY